MTLKSKVDAVVRHPFILGDIVRGKSRGEIRSKIRAANENQREREQQFEIECFSFISQLKARPYVANPQDLRRIKLCCVEDWDDRELQELEH